MTFHRDREPQERLDTCACAFCGERDPNFRERRVEDQLVRGSAAHVAASHITEDGHVYHRMLEVAMMQRRQKASRLYGNCA